MRLSIPGQTFIFRTVSRSLKAQDDEVGHPDADQSVATARFNALTDEGFTWSVADVYAAQNLCPYETVAYGYSKFCDLFTYEEWRDFGYSVDLYFSGGSAFHSPTAVGHHPWRGECRIDY